MLSIRSKKKPFNVKPSTRYLELWVVAHCRRRSVLPLLSVKHGRETSMVPACPAFGNWIHPAGAWRAVQGASSGWPLPEWMSMLGYCVRSSQDRQSVSSILGGFASVHVAACKLHSGLLFCIFLIFICIFLQRWCLNHASESLMRSVIKLLILPYANSYLGLYESILYLFNLSSWLCWNFPFQSSKYLFKSITVCLDTKTLH